MSLFFQKYKNVLMVMALMLVPLFLTSCRTSSNYWQLKAYNSWGDEFHFANWFDGFMGWSVSCLSYPFAAVCWFFGSIMGDSFFVGMIFLTLIIRTCTWPIFAKQNSLGLRMQLLQPEIEKLNKKYQFRRDPQSEQRKRQEMAMLYKKHKASPLGCIWPLLISMPIFFGMFEVVRRINITQVDTVSGLVFERFGTFNLGNTKAFGVFELAGTSITRGTWYDRVFCGLLATIYAVITYFIQKISQKRPSYMKKTSYDQKTKQQAKQTRIMNIIMIAMFVFFSLQSTALALYYSLTGIYQLFQTFINRRLMEKKYYKLQKAGK